MLSTGTLLALDILLMSVLFIFFKKRAAPGTMPVVQVKNIKDVSHGSNDTASTGNTEALTKSFSRLDLKASDLERLEKILREREKKLESLIGRVEERLKNIDLLYEEQMNNDVYGLAHRMSRKGSSREDISRKLDLLNGEAELIESINNYRAS